MKNLTYWLYANKIYLNAQKNELVIFKHQRKKLDCEVKIKLNRKRLYPTDSVEYLCIRIDKNLNWKHHVSDIAIKLNRADALLFKIRNFININTLKTIYYAIFDSHINYANVIGLKFQCCKQSAYPSEKGPENYQFSVKRLSFKSSV